MLQTRGFVGALVAGLALLAAPAGAAAAIVNNGDFESGSLSGWQHADAPDSTAGTWFAYTGTAAPLFGAPIAAPPQGMWAAVSDQAGAGRRILYQDVTVPGTGTSELRAFVYYRNFAGASLASPPNLDYTGPTNEQYRFDVVRPGAAIDSVASGDVLATLFQTATGGPQTLSPTQKTVDLSPFAGQTVRLRLAEVDNDGNLWASADAISVNGLTVGKAKLNKNHGTAKLPVTVTDPGTVTLSGKGVKPRSAPASKSVAVGAGTVKLLVKPKGKTQSKLNDSGKAKVKVTITYTPTGSAPLSDQAKIKLKKT